MNFIDDIVKYKIWKWDNDIISGIYNYEQFYTAFFWLTSAKRILKRKEIVIRKYILYKYLLNEDIRFKNLLDVYIEEDRKLLINNIKFIREDEKERVERAKLPIAKNKNFIGYFAEDLEDKNIRW